MSEALFMLPLGLAVAVGAVVAGCGQPACHWSSLSAIALKTRLAMLKTAPPGRRRSRLAAFGLAGLMCAAALTAYAAEPSGPDALPREVVGVVGSGDQLSLKVAQDQKIRTVKLGEEYRDGWKLESLTAGAATLSKDGQRREVGLNPTGALGETAPAADPSKVVVAGDTLEARSALETSILNEYWAATGRTDNSISLDEMAKVLSPARYQAFLENDERLGVLRKAQARADALARGDFNAVRAFDHLPVAGPDSFVVPSGMSVKEAAQALGLDSDLGYAIDGAAVAATKTLVLVKCFTPTTPVSANACKYL